MPMKCSRCGQPLMSVLEQTRGICATCHLFPEFVGRSRVNEPSGAAPPDLLPGESAAAETLAGEPEGPGEPAPAPAASDLDSDGSSTSALGDLGR